MNKFYLFLFCIIVILMLSCNNIIITNDIYLYSDYNALLNLMKNRLLYYTSKYENCNSTQTPLYCGHKYEGYKKQKEGFYPASVLVNISIYKHIKSSGNIICKKHDVVIGVVCAPDNFLQRLSLRMGYAEYNVLLLFFTGISDNNELNEMLKKENNYYHDIIIYDFLTHYFNSSLMLILEINWIYKNCNNYKYFIYQTPDVFFNYNLFYNTYINITHTYPLIAQILYRNRVLRSNKSRFYVPFSVYNKSHYPPQPNGPLVAFSLYTVKIIMNNIEKVKLTFWMDDVYLAFLVKQNKIETHNIKNAISLYPVQIKSLPNLSIIASRILYIHSLPPGSIFYLTQSTKKYYKYHTY